jgi:manganese efflux pump family protein
MTYLAILLTAIGLSFDTFAISVSAGISEKGMQFRRALFIAAHLALYQAIMPLIGYFLGLQVEKLISEYDHWFAFGILSALGLKMIIEGLGKVEQSTEDSSRLSLGRIQLMSLATSIDALAVGVSFAFVHINIWISAAIIGAVTALSGMLGMLAGKNVGNKIGKRTEILGGLILIGIGIKLLLEHH